jgi:hypothetical protein
MLNGIGNRLTDAIILPPRAPPESGDPDIPDFGQSSMGSLWLEGRPLGLAGMWVSRMSPPLVPYWACT